SSAKVAAATATARAASRRSPLCSPFTLIRAKARYSNGRVHGAESTAAGGGPRGGRASRGAVGRARMRWGSFGAERLQGVPADRGRRKANERPRWYRKQGLVADFEGDRTRAQGCRKGPPRPGLTAPRQRRPSIPRDNRHER